MTTADRQQRPGGTPSRRARLPAADRRETILRAAAEVFAEAGYRAAKVADIAARIGVTEPVIFQNFGSKAALFGAVIERAAAGVTAMLDDMTDAGPPGSLLAHVLTGHAREPRQHAAGDLGSAYGVLFADAVTLAAEPQLTEPARFAISAVAGHLADLIRRAQAAAAVRAEADPDAAAWLVLSVLASRRLRAAAMPGPLEPALVSLVLEALMPPESASG